MLKNFDQFILESENEDIRLINFFASLARNYESQKPFYTDLLQFVVSEERRDWRDTRKYVQLEKSVTHDARYKLKFTLDEKNYILEINFKFTFTGKNEKDAPETLTPEEMERLNVVLEKLEIRKISINSSDYKIEKSGKEISFSVKKACEAFLVKMMDIDYDTLGENIYKIEHS